MKWFDDWLNKKIRHVIDVDDENVSREDDTDYPVPLRYVKPARRLNSVSGNDSLQSTGITFALFNANGGYVIELREYDNQTDRFKNSLHVVPTGQELGKTLEHIITLEALKK